MTTCCVILCWGIIAMTFRRFLTWIVEKLVEWQLFVILLVAVKFALPTDPGSYNDFGSFGAGIREQFAGSVDEAGYMTHAFMGNSYFRYVLRTYEAAAYVVGVHFYFWSFYIFTSIFACLAAADKTKQRGYVPKAILAFIASAAILGVRLHGLFSLQNLLLATAMLIGGTVVVGLSALFGVWLDWRLRGGKPARAKAPPPADPHGRGKQASVRGRVRFDLSQ